MVESLLSVTQIRLSAGVKSLGAVANDSKSESIERILVLIDEGRLVGVRAVKEYLRQPGKCPRCRFFVHDDDKLTDDPVRGIRNTTVHLQIHAASKFLELYLLPNPFIFSSSLRNVR